MNLGLIEGIVGLLGTIATIYKTAQSRKYIDKINEAKKDLADEWNKGDKADLAKIESLYTDIKGYMEAYNQELLLTAIKT